jgi:hypothetical protein
MLESNSPGIAHRRIASFTSVAAPIEVDTAAIKQIIQAGMRSKDRTKRRAVLLALVHEVKYAEGVAELVLKIPTLSGVNCQHSERNVRTGEVENALLRPCTSLLSAVSSFSRALAPASNFNVGARADWGVTF